MSKAVQVTTAANAKPSAAIQAVSDADDLCWLSVHELNGLFGKKRLSPLDVTRAVLDQASRVAARYNAFTFIDEEGALASAKESEARWMREASLGELDGVPATIKDLMTVKGWPTRFGSRTMPDKLAVADAPSVEALRTKGTVLIGATTTPEFGWKAVTDSPLAGATSNPYDPSLTCGGSSGGAAVAALTGCGNVHLGTDGGGSVRIPAAMTGVVGHKPSFGRIPYHPPSAFGTVGHIGSIARSTREAAIMLDAMTIRDHRDWNQATGEFRRASGEDSWKWKNRRIGLWLTPCVGRVSPDILAAVIHVTRLIEDEGARVELTDLPKADILEIFNTIWFAGAASRLSKIDKGDLEHVDPGLVAAADLGRKLSAVQYSEALLKRAVFGAEMDQLLQTYDLVLSPTTPIAAFPLGHDVPPQSSYASWTEWACFNFPINLSQQPACSVPIGLTSGALPIGLQIIGARGGDREVLSAATQISELVGKIDSGSPKLAGR